jgi:hypothetical protein
MSGPIMVTPPRVCTACGADDVEFDMTFTKCRACGAGGIVHAVAASVVVDVKPAHRVCALSQAAGTFVACSVQVGNPAARIIRDRLGVCEGASSPNCPLMRGPVVVRRSAE